MHQRHLGLELGVEHDRTGHIAQRALGGALHDRHQAGEMQHQPHHDAAAHGQHPHPFVILVSSPQQHQQTNGNQYVSPVHGALLSTAGRAAPMPGANWLDTAG
ncbi:hypothetical protein D3C71_1815260 [compost metagenome]